MTRAIEDRVSRFMTRLADRDVHVRGPLGDEASSDLARAYVDSIYPPWLEGQVVLEEGVRPEAADGVIQGVPEIMALSRRYDGSETDAYPVWISDSPAVPVTGPSREHLVAHADSRDVWGGKPTGGCLFTSSGTRGDLGLWFEYLRAKPYLLAGRARAWRLDPRPDVRTLRIDSAVAWCELVHRYPRFTPTGLVPAWEDVRTAYGAVELTQAAVGAIDCVSFASGGEVVAASFWSVATTVWLGWEFTSATAMDVPSEL